MFCILAAFRVAHAGLTCEKRLEALALQAFQSGDGRDIRITRTARGVLVVAKDSHRWAKTEDLTVITNG
ncbi:hypothetical protein L245_26530 [Salmonella enterica subsp. enterica serovar Worthington str. BCH-4719]|nr:hypothetical protein L245_26530 [Salmonella enterica subsp. enterica serovar Worthington str. BCH-4719]KAF0778622.1 hypothetical protein L246_34450 [Salmonella enterica subsp. enterica serovar Worthington str. BCH-5715]KAF0779063.1 hypothetical protein L243_32530 [Salmonella enterica subsp. enterica serovar Worthington str. BCH-3008]